MHTKFGFNTTIREFDAEKLAKLLEFRIKFLDEELKETKKAAKEKKYDEVVDGLIDLIVVAVGTLDAFEVDSYRAWNVVHQANMTKERGINESRPNELGLPDLIKPEGWQAPDHRTNIGLLEKLK